ncbi:DUF5392 family protein [Virgibacillus sp. 179-BFC.A HS]|uniref:DUF5392 family protein n=1 Tax=Tigheibacillus jepli TaxID=3035914 RepID=A0ABU5CDB1_9BACI|nr:DUF5392 family protein [Virgibacillus sp. 179-BFC.A HS]MDY0404329.1 DUF5392 family protein [Virgibacillus sp. 179-BFC.A HS]
MNVFMTEMPAFIKNELEQLQKIIGPLMKKASKYTLWSWPMIGISLINLFFLLFVWPDMGDNYAALLVFALIGAFGFALSREAKHKKKEIQSLTTSFLSNGLTKAKSYPSRKRKNSRNWCKNSRCAACIISCSFWKWKIELANSRTKAEAPLRLKARRPGTAITRHNACTSTSCAS